MSYLNKKLMMPGYDYHCAHFCMNMNKNFKEAWAKKTVYAGCGIIEIFFYPFLYVNFYYCYCNTVFLWGGNASKIHYLRRVSLEHKLVKNKSVSNYLPISMQIESPKEEFTIYCLIWVIFHPFPTMGSEAPTCCLSSISEQVRRETGSPSPARWSL